MKQRNIYRGIVFLLMLGVIMVVSTTTLSADVGPKPSAEVTVRGHGEPYMFDVLIKINHSVDPYDSDGLQDRLHYYYEPEAYPDALNGYQDTEGYASMSLYDIPPRTIERRSNTFELGYFGAPREFKIALVFDDVVITSPSIERSQFNASFVYDVSDVDKSESQEGVGHIEEDIPYAQMSTDFFIRVILTVGLELLVLALFKYKKRGSYLLAGAVNLTTQSLLTFFVILGYYYWGDLLGALLVLILGELLVITAELIIYGFHLKEHSRIRALTYALCANIVSLIAGFVLMIL